MEIRAVGHKFERNPLKENPAMLALIWFSGFREDVNVKVYDGQTPSDNK
jgi:hypothetical protein